MGQKTDFFREEGLSTADSPESTPAEIPILVLAPQGPSFAKALERVEKLPNTKVVPCAEPGEALVGARNSSTCLVLGFASKQDEVVKLVTALKLLRENIAAPRGLKILVTIQFDRRVADAIAEKLLSYGCSEVLREPVNERALAFKIERLVRSLAATNESVRSSRVRETQRRASSEGRAESSEKSSSKVEVVAPLTIQSDCWLAGGGSVRKVTGRWVVKLTGPGPVAGRWTEMDQQNGAARSWKWIPSDPEKDPFIREKGAWVFQGDRTPEFTEELWTFVGKTPSLQFVHEGESFGVKFSSIKNGPLTLAKDSEAAIALVPEMRKTFHRVVRGGLGAEDGDGQIEIGGEEERVAPGAQNSGELQEGDSGATDKDYVDERPPASEAPLYIEKKQKEREAEDFVDQKPAEREAEDFVDQKPAEREGKDFIDRKAAEAPGTAHAQALGEKRRVELASDGSSVFHYRVEDFGTPGGQWEFVFEDSGGSGKWYVYVPLEILNGIPCDVRALPTYWWYLGAHRPTLSVDHSEWLFKDERPQACESFNELKEPLQRYLLERRPDAVGAGTESQADDKMDEGPFKGVKKRAVENPVAASALRVIEKGAEKRLPCEPEAERTPEQAEQSFRATDPASPTLGPLALSFLMSELLANRKKISLEKAGERFCGYLASSTGGLHAELWVAREGQWSVAAVSKNGTARLGDAVQSVSSSGGEVSVVDPSTVVALVKSRDGALLGAIGLSGDGAGAVPEQYLASVGTTTRGLLLELTSTARAAAA